MPRMALMRGRIPTTYKGKADGFALRFAVPFRFGIGDLFEFSDPETGHRLFVKNRVELGPEYDGRDQAYCSEVLIVFNTDKVRLPNRSVDIESFALSPDIVLDLVRDASRDLFNGFVVAYWMVLPQPTIGRLSLWVESHGAYAAILLFREKPTLSRADIDWLFDLNAASREPGWERDLLQVRESNVVYPDVTMNVSDRIRRAFDLQRRELCYEFEFEATVEPDPKKKLLWSCIALEAAHASFMRRRLKRHRKELSDEQVEKAVNDLLAVHGASKMLRVSQFLLMDRSEYPKDKVAGEGKKQKSRSMITIALEAITARNSIMHALEKRTDKERENFGDHANNALELMHIYKAIIEQEYEKDRVADATPRPE